MKRIHFALIALIFLFLPLQAAKFGFVLENASGEPQAELTVQIKNSVGTVVASTTASTIVDNGDGSYITSTDLASGIYSVYTGAGAGMLVPSLEDVSHVDADDVPSALPLPVSEGGTGATTAASARTNLGLEIGSDVQAYSSYTSGWATYFDWWLDHDDGGKTLMFIDGGTIFALSGSDARSALGLATAALEDTTTVGADGCMPLISDLALGLPERSSALTANASNEGKVYFRESGDAVTGTWGIYTIEKRGNGTNYSYYEVAIYEQTWDFSGGS